MERGILQDFLDHIKDARRQGLSFVEHILHFPKLLEGNKDHVKIVRDDTQTLVEQVYSDETIARIFQDWLKNQNLYTRILVKRLKRKIC